MSYKTISLTVAVIVVATGGFLLVNQNQPTTKENSSTSTAAQTQNCDTYTAQQDSEFRPGYLPQIDNRQAFKQAMIDYHGEDMEGKDGPLAKAGLDIAILYHEYRAYRCSDEAGKFKPKSVTDGDRGYISGVEGEKITVDMTASQSGEKLAGDLKSIGAEEVSSYQNGVSATISLEKIPKIVQLKSLNSMMVSRATTNSSAGSGLVE